MPRIFDEAEAVESIAKGLIANYHPHLAEARILYAYVDKASKKGGRELLGKVQKVSGWQEWALEKDFFILVPLDKWNDLTEAQRTALVDHLLERCAGEEQDDNSMRWMVRDPDVQEFTSILRRHGVWHSDLVDFVSVAQEINLDDIIQEEADIDLSEEVEETVTTTQNED